MNKFTTSIVRLDYDAPAALSDVLRVSAADPLLKDFAGVCGITHGVVQPNQYGIRLRVGKHVQAEAKGSTVVVQNEGEPPQSYHVYESISRLRSLMK